MIRQAISCDICGTEKRQTNHWFVAFEQGGELRLGGWGSRNGARPGSKHLCGQTCVHKLVDEYMAKTVALRPNQASDEFVEAVAEHWQSAVPATEAETRGNAASEATSARPRTTAKAKRTVEASRPPQRPRQSAPSGKLQQQVSPIRLASEQRLSGVDDLQEMADLAEDESSARLLPPADSPRPRAVRVVMEDAPALSLHPGQGRGGAATAIGSAMVTTRVTAGGMTRDGAMTAAAKTLIELPIPDDAPGYSSRRWRAEAWERERARELSAGKPRSHLAERLRTN